MSYVLTFNMAAPGNLVFDLRNHSGNGTRIGLPYHHACKLEVSLIASSGTPGNAIVQAVDVANDAPAPSAATLSPLPTSGNPYGVALLDTALNPKLVLGQAYSKGFTTEVFQAPVGSHLLVTCTAAAILQIVVD